MQTDATDAKKEKKKYLRLAAKRPSKALARRRRRQMAVGRSRKVSRKKNKHATGERGSKY